MAKHKNGDSCEKCLEILNFNGGTDSVLASWFLLIKSKFHDVHVSTSGRNETEQNKMFAQKRSLAKWTESPHNYQPSCALDLFFIDQEGKALFSIEKYKELLFDMPNNITWGGTFKKFPDAPHFERTQWKKIAKTLIWSK
jgi:hypothetical protein